MIRTLFCEQEEQIANSYTRANEGLPRRGGFIRQGDLTAWEQVRRYSRTSRSPGRPEASCPHSPQRVARHKETLLCEPEEQFANSYTRANEGPSRALKPVPRRRAKAWRIQTTGRPLSGMGAG